MDSHAQTDLVRFEELSLADDHCALRHTALIPASLAQVWEAFTTSEGLMTFAAPVVKLDLRIGGIWESSYNPQGEIPSPNNILNEILSFLPMEMFSIRIRRTPPGFPDPELGKRLWTVMRFTEVAAVQTRVEITMLGYHPGEKSSPVYQLFQRGNASVLSWLYERFTVGPRQWE